MDSLLSLYVPMQTSPMIQLVNDSSNLNDQPADFGLVLWDVLDQIGSSVGGVKYFLSKHMGWALPFWSVDPFLFYRLINLFTDKFPRIVPINSTPLLKITTFDSLET